MAEVKPKHSRNYHYDPILMKHVLALIKNHDISLRKASSVFGIPRVTLHDKYRMKYKGYSRRKNPESTKTSPKVDAKAKKGNMSVKRVKIEIIQDSAVSVEETTQEAEAEVETSLELQVEDGTVIETVQEAEEEVEEDAVVDNVDELNKSANDAEAEEGVVADEGETSRDVEEVAEAVEGIAEDGTEEAPKEQDTVKEQVSRVFMRNCEKLSTERAATILSDALEGHIDKNRISTASPVEPKGGDVFLIELAPVGDKKDALQDGFYWRHDGNKKYPKSFKSYMKMGAKPKPKPSKRSNFINVIKSIYKIRDTATERGFSGTFQRHTFMPYGQEDFIVIHYMGDEKNIQPESYRGVVPVRAYRRSLIRTPKDHHRVASSCFNCLSAPDDIYNRSSTHCKMTGKLNEKRMDVVTVRTELSIIQAVEEIMEGVVTVSMMKRYCGSFMCHDCALVLRQAINRKTEAESNLRELHKRIDKVSNEERRMYYRENYATDKSGRCWGCMLEFNRDLEKKKEKYGRHCLQMSLISGMSVLDGIETMLEDEAESLFGLSPKRLFICKQCFLLMRMIVRAQCSYDNLQSNFTRRTHPHSLMAELQGIVPDSEDFTVPPLNDSDLENFDDNIELDEEDEFNDSQEVESDENDEGSKKRVGDFNIDTPSKKRAKIDGSEDDAADADTDGGNEVTVTADEAGEDGGRRISIRLTAIKSKGDTEDSGSAIKLRSPMKGSPVTREKRVIIKSDVSSDSWSLTYNSKCPGATGLVRLMLEVTGVQYRDEEIPDSQTLPYPTLPIIRKGDVEISHSLVICKYLGEEYGLCPESTEDKLLAEQIAQNCLEYLREGRFALNGNVLTSGDSEFKERHYVFKDKFIKDRQPMWLTYFEQCLQVNKEKKRFLFGSALSYADVALYQVLQATQYQFATQYTDATYIPLLKGYSVRVGDVAKIKAYHKSSRYQGIGSYKF